MTGLGSILGTGLFVSLAIATKIGGDGVLIAIILAALVAILNGLSSAQLAANFPVSGGTYEYGYRVLNSWFGFTAGWMFLIAKSASAATAALGCAGYLIYLFGTMTGTTVVSGEASGMGVISGTMISLFRGAGQGHVLLALLLLAGTTALVAGGIRRSNRANIVIVGITLAGLLVLVTGGIMANGIPYRPAVAAWSGFEFHGISPVLYATALMFVAYTGYGRIATLGEEVIKPEHTIPRAIVISMAVIVIIYFSVSLTALEVLGSEAFGRTVDSEAAPLIMVARALTLAGPFKIFMVSVVSIAAVTAMTGVLLNLILGLSRVILGMARRGDLPGFMEQVKAESGSPVAAVWVTGGVIGLLVMSGDITFTWSFSAFTVLIYYAITNLSALMLPAGKRLYPRWIPALGLLCCLSLAFWIDPQIWLTGLSLIAAGLLWHAAAGRRAGGSING